MPQEHTFVHLEGDEVCAGLRFRDPVLADLLRRQPEADWPTLVERALAVGARGLMQMGVGVDLAEVDARVRRSVDVATAEAEARVEQLLATAGSAMAAALDPAQRSSMVARAMEDFREWRDGFLRVVDPEVASSHTGKLMADLRTLLGPGGALEERLAAALDPSSDGSGLGRLAESIERRFSELREILAEQRGRAVEAERGTAKGFDYEDVVEMHLREAARSLGGLVERTSRETGSLSGDALVGDCVVTLPSGARIVVEAKHNRSVGLTGSGGILAELDRALANRAADVAICVSATEAYPAEVGVFGIYGNRLLVVDEGDGTMTWVALRWAAAQAEASRNRTPGVDLARIGDRIERIGQMSTLFSSNKKALTDIAGSVEKVKGNLEAMRRQLLEAVDDLAAELMRGAESASRVIEMRREAG